MSFQKQKGNAFERKVAQLLKDISGANWTRTPYSGAFLGRSNSGRVANLDNSQVAMLKGDIANPEGYQVVIECKSHAEFSFSAMVNNGYAKLDGWCEEAFADSNRGEIPYMLCFNITRNGDYVALPTDIFSDIGDIASKVLTDSDNPKSKYRISVINYYNAGIDKRFFIIPLWALSTKEIWKAVFSKIYSKK